jgi:hypothetical protein
MVIERGEAVGVQVGRVGKLGVGVGVVEIKKMLQIVQFIDFFLIYFFKMMGSYKFPESFEEIVVADGLEGKVLVGDSELNAK